MAVSKKHIPGSDVPSSVIFDFPFLIDSKTVSYFHNHGRIMFIIRGPPGTGKGSLKDLVCEHYPNGSVFSADAYFDRPFAGPRNRESLKASHSFCQKKVAAACRKNCHPIIVENTHIQKWEMTFYFKLAIKHSYTIVMAETPRKLETKAQILARTNRKQLSESYLHRKLKQWEEVIPPYTGWMLSPHDESYLQKYFMNMISQLEENEFKKELTISKDGFIQGQKLYCIASYNKMGVNSLSEKKFHLSDKVQALYGKMFSLVIKGFIIADGLFLGIVPLNEEQLSLIFKEEGSKSSEQLEELLAGINIQDMPEEVVALDLESISGKPTFIEEEWDGDNINIMNCSFIVLGTLEGNTSKFPHIQNVESFRKQFADSDIFNSDGMLLEDKVSFHLKNSKVYKVKDGMWLICPKDKLTVESVFTGIYI